MTRSQSLRAVGWMDLAWIGSSVLPPPPPPRTLLRRPLALPRALPLLSNLAFHVVVVAPTDKHGLLLLRPPPPKTQLSLAPRRLTWQASKPAAGAGGGETGPLAAAARRCPGGSARQGMDWPACLPLIIPGRSAALAACQTDPLCKKQRPPPY